jgi:EmrB/QacA subfamily drug resistance transporter
MTTALGLAIVTEAFPAAERGKALGIAGALVSIGIVAGPTLGGLLLDAFSWHWIFFVNLPVGLIGTLMVLRFVPAIKPVGGQRFDFVGAATLFVSLLSLLLALTLGQQEGFGDTRVASLFATCAVFLTFFLAVERKNAQPMIDLRLFQNTLFNINLITGFLTFLAISGTIILMPFFLENILGYGPRAVGLMLAAVPLGFAVMSPISGSLSDRFGTRPIAAIGLAVTLVGYYAISSFDADTTSSGYILHFLPIAIGIGIFSSPNNSAILGAAPRERLGVASGLLALTRSLGQTTGIAVLGALWTGRVLYHAGPSSPGTATSAPTAAQIAGLQDTLLVIILLGVVALALAVWAMVQERRERTRAVLPVAADPNQP